MNDNPLTALSLFTGAGGGELAWQHLLGHRTLGYVEWDPYCQRVLRQRMLDGVLDLAPMYGDIRAFLDSGHARRYRGMVDVVTAGFPCVEFSPANPNRDPYNSPKNQWPNTIEAIREIRPRIAWLENSTGLLGSHGYFGQVLFDLASSGYSIRWMCLSAIELGAPYVRDRVWIMAHLSGGRHARTRPDIRREDTWADGRNNAGGRDSSGSPVACAKGEQVGPPGQPRPPDADRCADAYSSNNGPRRGKQQPKGTGSSRSNAEIYADVEGKGQPGARLRVRQETPYTSPPYSTWWETEPNVVRVVPRGTAWVDRAPRIKALGNLQVPIVAATAWRLLGGG